MEAAVCLCTAFQAWTWSCLCGENARREASLSLHLPLHCQNSEQCAWAGHAIPALEVEAVSMLITYWHIHRIPSCPLDLITTCLFLDEPWDGLLEEQILLQALENTGQKEQSESSSPPCLAPQQEWQRGREHRNSVVAVVQCCTHGQRCKNRSGWHLFC